MSLLSKTRTAFAWIFASALFITALCNIYFQGPRLLADLSEIRLPGSLSDLRDASRRIAESVSQNLEGKYAAWEAYALIQQSLGKSEMNDFSVIKAADGRLYRGGLHPLVTGNAKTLAGDIAVFAELAQRQDAKVLYVNTPDTIVKGTRVQPEGMPYRDYNVASDTLLNTLRERGVPTVDTRYLFARQGFDAEKISPKTSFLLSAEAAFAVFGYIIEALEQKFSLELDPEGFYRDIGNYEVTLYPDFFMGELGKETGPSFGGLADFKTVAPAFETEFVYEGIDMFDSASSVTGDAQNTLLHPDALIYYENLYRLYPQSYYKHTNAVWSKVVNTRNAQGPKILVLHDYYTAQIISHLAPLCSEMHTLAYQGNLFTNASEYIRNNEFDYIIISFFPQNLVRPETQLLFSDGKE